MSNIAAAPNVAEEPAKKPSKQKTFMMAAVVGLMAAVGGTWTPMFAHFGAHADPPEQEANAKHDPRQSITPFDAITVNVRDGRYNRYLRVKIAVVADARDEK